jgi:hypothetical protein
MGEFFWSDLFKKLMRRLKEIIRGCTYSKDDLEKALNELGAQLPISLRTFYLENAGQKFYENKFLEYKIAGWFNVKAGKCEEEQIGMSLQETFNHSREFVPGELIPFAYNDLNDYYLIAITDGIYFLRNDMIYNEIGALVKIADSFEEFINGLKAEETPLSCSTC